MSAYVVGKADIDYILSAAETYAGSGIHLRRTGEAGATADLVVYRGANGAKLDEVGRVLWAENVASVAHRYPDSDTSELPGPIPTPYPGAYTFTRHPYTHPVKLDPVTALAQVNHLRYQSCEHPGWPESEAALILHRFEQAFIRALPGYDDAPWGID